MNIHQPIHPMLLTPSSIVPSGDEWIYQLKLDGIRMLYQKSGRVQLFTRHQTDITQKFPELLSDQLPDSIVLDGENIVIENGKPVLEHVLHRLKTNKPDLKNRPAQFMVFDILHLNGQDLLNLPLIERLDILQSLKLPDHFGICPIHSNGQELFQATKNLQLEGIVAKQKRSRYVLDQRSKTWIKIKHYMYTKAVVVAIAFDPFRILVVLPDQSRETVQFAPPLLRKKLISFTKQSISAKKWIPVVPMRCEIKHPGYTLHGRLRSPCLTKLDA